MPLIDLHVVLDIDGTLVFTRKIENQASLDGIKRADFNLMNAFETVKRPGLDEFLLFCFTRFKSVSIWTAGSEAYAAYIAANICPQGQRFSSIRCIDHCVLEMNMYGYAVRKPLNELWRHGSGLEVDELLKTTLIIEDSPETCAYNADNAIFLPSYCGIEWDRYLNWLQYYMDKCLDATVGDVRLVNKSTWMDDVRLNLSVEPIRPKDHRSIIASFLSALW